MLVALGFIRELSLQLGEQRFIYKISGRHSCSVFDTRQFFQFQAHFSSALPLGHSVMHSLQKVKGMRDGASFPRRFDCRFPVKREFVRVHHDSLRMLTAFVIHYPSGIETSTVISPIASFIGRPCIIASATH
jgi:hypothetical protein